MSFTLEYDGTNQSFAAWGIERANLSERSLATGGLTITVRTVDANADPIFAYKGKVTIWQGATKRFVGWVTSVPAFCSAQTEFHQYTISDAWWWLENIIFRDVSGPFYAETDAEGVYPQWPYCSMCTIGNSGLVLNVGGTWTAKNIGEIVEDACGYAYNCGADIGTAMVSMESYSFLEDARDLTCAELIRRALNWSPTAATWWDYTSTSPRLNCEKQSLMSDVSVELGGASAESWELTPRYDMQFEYVRLYIIRERQRADGTRFKTINNEGTAPAWPGVGSLIASIVMGTDENGVEEEVPPNIAANLASDLSVLPWEGRVTCVESECSFIAHPGNAINLTGSKSRTAWNSMDAVVQQCDYDLVTGRSTITFGPPSHLSPQDMISIFNTAKAGRPPVNPPNPGGGPGGGGAGGGKPAQPQALELCDGSTINVLISG